MDKKTEIKYSDGTTEIKDSATEEWIVRNAAKVSVISEDIKSKRVNQEKKQQEEIDNRNTES